MTATRSTTFTTTMRVINRVHGNTTNRRSHTSPALRTGFAELTQVVFAVTYLANRGATVNMNLAHLAGTQPHGCVRTFARSHLSRTTRRANQLSAFTRLQLDAVN